MTRRERSIDPDWFEDLFAREGDPWDFATSDYERAKYDDTLSHLPTGPIGRTLEVGCANGVLTDRLAPFVTELVATDVSATALAAARERCAGRDNVRFVEQRAPRRMPPGPFALAVLSEVVYYWDRADVTRLADWARRGGVGEGGHLLLVHWTGDTDYPQSGDAAIEQLLSDLGDRVAVEVAERRDRYRLDRWRLVGPPPDPPA